MTSDILSDLREVGFENLGDDAHGICAILGWRQALTNDTMRNGEVRRDNRESILRQSHSTSLRAGADNRTIARGEDAGNVLPASLTREPTGPAFHAKWAQLLANRRKPRSVVAG